MYGKFYLLASMSIIRPNVCPSNRWTQGAEWSARENIKGAEVAKAVKCFLSLTIIDWRLSEHLPPQE
jgi:hypothetical protein